MEQHHVLRVNIFRTIASPSVSPPQADLPAFLYWQTAIPSGPSFDLLGFQVAHYPWFKGSRSADGSNHLTHVGTHWSLDFPFLPLVLLFALPSVITILLAWRRRIVMSRVGRCTKCGYNLTANASGVCPECGTAINSKDGQRDGQRGRTVKGVGDGKRGRESLMGVKSGAVDRRSPVCLKLRAHRRRRKPGRNGNYPPDIKDCHLGSTLDI
jgi:predicted RNA-binding Zn-ribbon protein involved in translation (DUF1610 family)